MLSERIIEKTQDLNIPLSVSFELTYRCNLHCLMCYQSQAESAELTTDEVKSVISQLAAAGCLYLSFTGGEPLLRKDFWEIAEFARGKSFAIVLQTNGTLIRESEARNIKELGFLQVQISLLGASAQTHDMITQVPGSFEKAILAAKVLIKKGVTVVFKTTLLNQNFSEYKQIKQLAEKIGAKPYFSPVLFPKNDKDITPLQYRLTDDNLNQLFYDLTKEYGDILPEFNSSNELALCNMGKTECNISPEADMYPCVAVPVSLGNLKEQSFKEIWKDSPILKRIRERSQDNMPGCQDCENASACILCPGLSLTEDNDIFSKASECCRITKIVKEVGVCEKEKV